MQALRKEGIAVLLLCSDGLTGKKLFETVKTLTAGAQKAALVVTADNVYKEKNHHVPRAAATLEALGLSVDPFDLDTMPPERLLSYDVIECIGGNPFYLKRAILLHGAKAAFAVLSQKKLLIGRSAAAFVFGPSLEPVYRYSPELNEWDAGDLSGLGLTNVEVLPHCDRFLTRFADFEQTCRAYERERGVRVMRLNDGDGVLIDGESVSRIGA